VRLGQEHAACERRSENSNISAFRKAISGAELDSRTSEFTANLTIQRQLVVPINGIVPYVNWFWPSGRPRSNHHLDGSDDAIVCLAVDLRAQTERLLALANSS